LHAQGPDQVEVYLVVEGERGGIPVFCTALDRLKVDGRAIASRLLITPADAGLANAPVDWISLQVAPNLTEWRRARLDGSQDGWTLPVGQLPDPADGIEPAFGTLRCAASIRLPSGRTLDANGYQPRPEHTSPDHAPGYAVIRSRQFSVDGELLGFARVPVCDNATPAHARAHVAATRCGLVYAAYEELADSPLNGDWSEPPTAASWSWLFETFEETVMRRQVPGAACVSGRGRGIAWADRTRAGGRGLVRGDVLVWKEGCMVLERDDGDGWLSNGDRVFQGFDGELAATTLEDLPVRRGTIVRFRNFQELRKGLTEAGYGELGFSWTFGPDVQVAVRSFQEDHELPATGIPDEATRDALEEFLRSLRAADRPAASGAGD
ncbi:MAG: peptidoglycan-binding protein, partial [Gemmatimonadetes bacterium]|nr:peptidoglycan-binding protein [Gemmatimonadota bacterium]